jgi:hypothetical protein
MILRFETPLALTVLGLLASACVVPETDDTNDDLGMETEDTETDGSTDESDESESDSSSSSDDAESSSSSSSSDDVDTADTLEDTAESDTDGDQCECIPEQEDYEPPMMPTCGDMLCDSVNSADDPDEEFGKLVTNPEALECALIALRDRTPGIVAWSSSFNGGQFSDTGYVLIDATGEAIRREWGANDLSYDVDPALRFDLPEPSYYEDCLANPTDSERYYCLRAYPAPDPAPFVCEAGWSESDG